MINHPASDLELEQTAVLSPNQMSGLQSEQISNVIYAKKMLESKKQSAIYGYLKINSSFVLLTLQ